MVVSGYLWIADHGNNRVIGAQTDYLASPSATSSPSLTSVASQSGSPTSVASQSGSPTSVASQSGSPTSVASQSGSPTSVASLSNTATASSLASQTNTTSDTSIASASRSTGASLSATASASIPSQSPSQSISNSPSSIIALNSTSNYSISIYPLNCTEPPASVLALYYSNYSESNSTSLNSTYAICYVEGDIDASYYIIEFKQNELYINGSLTLNYASKVKLYQN